MNMYFVSFVSDGFKTLILTATNELAARKALSASFTKPIILKLSQVG